MILVVSCMEAGAFRDCLAQPATGQEKLATLRDAYEKAVDRATAPINSTYQAELERLKTELTKAGNLEGALAVDKEIKGSSGKLVRRRRDDGRRVG